MKYTRQHQIEKYVLEHDFVSLDVLCQEFGISKNTIRRDISELLENGCMEKVYGGVRAVRNTAPGIVNFDERNRRSPEAKNAIGAMAARYVKDNDVIFLDSGTTTLSILRNIAHLAGVTVLTNNLMALSICLAYPQLTAIALGGQLNLETASFSSNYCSLENIQRFNINKCFMATTGVTVDKGATNSTSGELVIKKTVMENSDACILVADAEKFGRSALLTYAPLTAFHRVITDQEPDAVFSSFFTANNIDLVTG